MPSLSAEQNEIISELTMRFKATFPKAKKAMTDGEVAWICNQLLEKNEIPSGSAVLKIRGNHGNIKSANKRIGLWAYSTIKNQNKDQERKADQFLSKEDADHLRGQVVTLERVVDNINFRSNQQEQTLAAIIKNKSDAQLHTAMTSYPPRSIERPPLDSSNPFAASTRLYPYGSHESTPPPGFGASKEELWGQLAGLIEAHRISPSTINGSGVSTTREHFIWFLQTKAFKDKTWGYHRYFEDKATPFSSIFVIPASRCQSFFNLEDTDNNVNFSNIVLYNIPIFGVKGVKGNKQLTEQQTTVCLKYLIRIIQEIK